MLAYPYLLTNFDLFLIIGNYDYQFIVVNYKLNPWLTKAV